MRKATKRKLLVTSLCSLGALLVVGCTEGKTGKPVNFDDVTATVNMNEAYVLPVAMRDTNGDYHKITYEVKTRDGEKVGLIENSIIATDFSGYIAKGTAKIGNKTYERTFTIGVTGLDIDSSAVAVSQGDEVELPVPDFYVSSVKQSNATLAMSVEYVAPMQNGKPMQIHGYQVPVTDDGFSADIGGTYTVTWQLEHDGEIYECEKTYVASKKAEQAHVLNTFDSPEAHATVEANYEWYKEFEGEYGVLQIDTITVWPQARLRIAHSITSYQEAGYKYVVMRMFFPEEGPTWTSMNFGNNKGAYVSATPTIVKGEWVNYYFDASAFYSSYANVTNENGGFTWNGKLYQSTMSEEGAVAYIADAWMETTCPYGVQGTQELNSQMTYLVNSEDALVKDSATQSAIAAEIADNGFVLQLHTSGNWPMWPGGFIVGLNHHWKELAAAHALDGSNRYVTLKTYMPSGMKWGSVRLATSSSSIYSDSKVYSVSGKWVTHIIDLLPIYEYVLENDAEPWIYLRSGSACEYDGELGNVTYFSVCRYYKEGEIEIPETVAGKITSAYENTTVEFITDSEDAVLTDTAVRADLQAEIDDKGGILEITSTNGPLTYIQGLNGKWRALAENWKATGENRYLIVRMYFVDGMVWKTPKIGQASGTPVYYANYLQDITAGEWFDVVLDLSAIYELVLADESANPWLYFRTEIMSGEYTCYVSEVRFDDETDGKWTGDIILPKV